MSNTPILLLETKCRKCGETIKINLGSLTQEEALDAVAKLDRQPGECPGFHVELCGWDRMWGMSDAVNAHFDRLKVISLSHLCDSVRQSESSKNTQPTLNPIS